jgi:hypothetical protein
VTEPQPVMAQAEQDQLTRQVGRSLLTVAGEGWQRVRAEYRSAGRHIEVDVFVTGPDGAEHPVRPPQEVVEGLGRLRQGMYRPGRGTWLSGVYLLEPPSSFSAEFEPDAEPRWRRVPPPIGFADELKFFPRADENIPDWLRQRAGLPPLQPAADEAAGQPTPPPGIPAGPSGGRQAPPPGQFGGQPGQHPQRAGEPTPPRGVPSGPFGGQQGGGEPTPPPGAPAGQFGGRPTPQPGTPAGPFGGQGHSQPAPGGEQPSRPGTFDGQAAGPSQPGEPTPPPGIPAGPFSGQAGQQQPGEAAGPYSQHGSGEPTPPPGIPANPFGGQPAGNEPTPPPGIPAVPFGGQPGGQPQHRDNAGPFNQQSGGEPTPPPGVPAGPFSGQPQPREAAAPFSQQGSGEPAPPQGVPAGPFGQTANAPQGGESWFGGQIAEAEGKPAPRGFGVPATPFPPDEQRR